MEEDASDFDEEYVTENIDNVADTGVDDKDSDGECVAAFENITKLAPFKKGAILSQPLQSKLHMIYFSNHKQIWEAIVGIVNVLIGTVMLRDNCM